MRAVFAALFVLSVVACGPPAAAPRSAPTSSLDSISGRDLRSHIEVLAADDMQGREAGTEGHLRAADYVASSFEALGLSPLGDAGSYLQNIDFLETRLEPGSATLVLRRAGVESALADGDDFVSSGGFAEHEETVSAPLVFVGYGITAPEYGHDDFDGVDVSGKILVVFTGAPPRFANDERAFYSSFAVKQALAVGQGAIGIVTIRTPVDAKRLTWPRMLQSAGSSGMRWLDAEGRPHEGFEQLAGDAMLSDAGAGKLFGMAGRDLGYLFRHHAEGETGSFDLDVSATMSRRSVQRRRSSPNVLGLLTGSDARLRDEYVLFTAHLDHLGVRPGGDGDDIFNGAYDNAAGVATLLEVAGALAGLSPRPRRSLIFAAVTAEEKGLRGSDFLAHNPPVPIDRIVANINIDMPFLGHPIADVEGFGAEHSTLHGALTRATARLGLVLTPDPRPELVRFIRSDQFSFVKQGVPGLNLKPGSTSADDGIDGAALRAAFLADHYHSVSDDLDLPFSETGAMRFARVAAEFGLIVANGDEAPRWKPGDFFLERFGRGSGAE